MFQPVSLPPNVDGEEQGEVRLQVNAIRWPPAGAPRKSHVRVKWWGERGAGTLFRPPEAPLQADDSEAAHHRPYATDGAPSPQNVVYYPFNCDVRTLMRYFDDMRMLVLDVTDGISHKVHRLLAVAPF